MRDKRSSGSPDDEHLHALIKIKLIRPYFSQLSPNRRNSLVAPLVWVIVPTLVAIASLWSDHQMVGAIVLFVRGRLSPDTSMAVGP